MKYKKEYAILLFIIAVLVYYISSQRRDVTHYELPEIGVIQSTDISKIRITKNNTETVVIREGDAWRVGPERYPAGGAAIEKIIKRISGLKLTAMVSESKNYPLYELDKEHEITVEAYRGDKSLLAFSIGKPASSYRHTFVLLGDDPRVYHAEGNLRNEFDKTVHDLRDKQVMNISDDIMEVTLTKGDKTVTVVKETAPVSVDVTSKKQGGEPEQPEPAGWVIPGGKPVKQQVVEELISTLSHLECDAFIENKSTADYTSPVYTATLRGVNTYTLSFFEKKDNQYAAVSSQNDYPFLLSEWKAERIMKDPGSLTEKAE